MITGKWCPASLADCMSLENIQRANLEVRPGDGKRLLQENALFPLLFFLRKKDSKRKTLPFSGLQNYKDVDIRYAPCTFGTLG